MTRRRKLTRAEKLEVMARQGWRCGCGCGGPVWPGAHVEYDHVRPVELYGADEKYNLRALLIPCHRKKTRSDVSRIAKAKRQARETGRQKPGRKVAKIRSRGFQGSRNFQGQVTWKS